MENDDNDDDVKTFQTDAPHSEWNFSVLFLLTSIDIERGKVVIDIVHASKDKVRFQS